MLGIGSLRRAMARAAVVIAVLTVSGCSILSPQPEPVPQPEVVVEPVVVTPVVVETPEPEPTPEPIFVAPPPKLPPVAIVITNSQPAFLDVAESLGKQLDDFKIFDLSDKSRPPVSVLRAINDSDPGTVVAIGLRAAQSSIAMADAPVIFSQVFNYRDHGLLTANSRGVAPLAPLDAQLAAWIDIDPGLKRIGMIVGEGHEELVAEAEVAAQKNEIQLNVRVARSDQETLHIFRRMAHDIDGFWLIPDNRIHSARSLREILDISKRDQVSVAVPNQSMLAMGATVSIESQADDIAATIARIIRKIHSDGLQSIPPISPLSAVRVVTRDDTKVVNR
jgi:ABC-type uncharacterized transport system substrate-binding protein